LTTSSQVTLMKNPWADVVISGTSQALFKVGIPNATIAASEYGWVQTWGSIAGWDNENSAIGALLTGGTGTAGRIEAQDAVAEQIVGVQLYTGVDTEYYPKFLTIAP